MSMVVLCDLKGSRNQVYFRAFICIPVLRTCPERVCFSGSISGAILCYPAAFNTKRAVLLVSAAMARRFAKSGMVDEVELQAHGGSTQQA